MPASPAFDLSALLDALPGPVIVVGDDTCIEAANAPARGLFAAVRSGAPLALTLRDPNVLDAIGRVLSSGTREVVAWRERVPVERAFEVTLSRLDGRPGQDAGGGRPLVVLSLTDQTEARRLERMRADFIANASHELRTPLASLLGFVETLQGPARDDAAARERFLGIMAEQGRRMARLIDDLLSLSRIEQMLHLRPSAPVDLTALVRHVADTLAPLAIEQGVRLVIATEAPVVVTGERDEIIRVAENLIENAIKYGCPEGLADPHVEIAVATVKRYGALTVRDHGPGIPAWHLPRLTERFYRVDAGQSRAKGGTGLGLALVKHVMAHHRGRLTIDSTTGQGACFTARFPLHGEGVGRRML